MRPYRVGGNDRVSRWVDLDTIIFIDEPRQGYIHGTTAVLLSWRHMFSDTHVELYCESTITEDNQYDPQLISDELAKAKEIYFRPFFRAWSGREFDQTEVDAAFEKVQKALASLQHGEASTA